MSQDFNPYREWLGVTSSSPSPSYYELLGLGPLEGDVAKIDSAYQRQSNQLAARLSGSQAMLAQRLMGELAEARMTLMTPTAKRAYDQALVARGPAAPTSAASDIQDMLPPAASPRGAGPSPVVLPNAAVYLAPQAYPASPGQPGTGAHPASPVVPNYYVPPQAVASAPVVPVQSHSPGGVPTIRRRPARRRSSPVPALFVTAVVVAGTVGAMWFYFKGDETVAMMNSGDGDTPPANSTPPDPRSRPPQPEQRAVNAKNASAPAAGRTGSDAPDDTETEKSAESPEPVPNSMDDPSMAGVTSPEADGGKPSMEKPEEQGAMSASPSEKSSPEKAQPDKPLPEPKPSQADPEEAAAVAKVLKDVRAALANRDLPKAKDLLDEATIEATATDTLAEVNRVEMLTSYVEMFWDAARKTLPKLQAAETIEIAGKEVAIVDADEDHLVVRIDGRNLEYVWTKIPAKMAYYLADRWLAPDDPVRNLVLAAFEMVEPKGDLVHAASLLHAASAARLNTKPLDAELKAARGG
ncbi:MAG TPA: hypothetical protein VG826_12280 [Pirellulales bacterium]|nr:hypothetical protein [Pirellulales bacterium]